VSVCEPCRKRRGGPQPWEKKGEKECWKQAKIGTSGDGGFSLSARGPARAIDQEGRNVLAVGVGGERGPLLVGYEKWGDRRARLILIIL